MKIKRYVAENMRAALNEITEELGSDAVILSSKKLEDGVEVMAAVDFDETIFNKENVQKVKAPTQANQNLVDKADYAKRVEWVSDPAIDGMQARIKNLEGLLQEHLNYQKWHEVEMNMPNKAEVIKGLVDKGFETEFIRDALQQLPDFEYFEIAWQEAQKKLVEKLSVESDPVLNQPGVYALLGTTGVGKTTTIAKLAARYALRYSQDDIGLITTDIYRIAAKEQLSVYANILNIPVFVAETEKQLQNRLHKLRGKQVVLIDTAGFSQKDSKFVEQIDFLQHCSSEINFLSVLSASMNHTVQEEVIQLVKQYGVNSTIITKLDESNSLGEILSLIMKHQLKIVYLCNGQRVPEDIKQANAIELIKLACASTLVSDESEALNKYTEAAGIGLGEKYVKAAY